MPKATLLVFSNAAPGQETEYNAWYDEVHIPDVLRLPGVLSARRFRLSAEQLDPTAAEQATRYVAVYDVDPDSLSTLREALHSSVQSGQMTMSAAVADMNSVIYEEITPMRTRE